VFSFKELIKNEKPLILPGVFNPLVGLAAKEAGFKALYLSGGAFSASMGRPDIGLIDISELVTQAKNIVAATDLPLLVDADTGFEEEFGVGNSVAYLKTTNAAGIHIEDQVDAKKCGHLEGKQLISKKKMCEKVKEAAQAKGKSDFFIMARTDARGVEGIEAAIDRTKAYVKAGADGIFPEGLTSKEEFAQFAKEMAGTPLLANMTEFGKTPFITASEFGKIGYNMVIYPVTTLRLAMKAVEKGLKAIKQTGTQESLINEMQTRKELYKLLDYDGLKK